MSCSSLSDDWLLNFRFWAGPLLLGTVFTL
jgi:hypothetical protein